MTESLKTAAEEKVISIMREKNSAAALCQEQDEQVNIHIWLLYIYDILVFIYDIMAFIYKLPNF